jgi:hypothetical protein
MSRRPNTRPSIGGSFDELARRLRELEQRSTNPELFLGTAGNPFTGVYVDTGSGVLEVTANYGVPENLTVTPGTFYNDIYAAIEWDPPATGTPPSYEVQLAKIIAMTPVIIKTDIVASSSYRAEALEASTDYSVRVASIDRLGRVGTYTAWEDFNSGIDSTIPPAVTGITGARGATTVIVKFTPLTASQAPDVANGNGLYEILLDTSNVWASPTSERRSMRSTASVVAFSDVLTASGTWYARVRAIDSSGNEGAWAESANLGTMGGVNDSMIVADLSAAKITVGEMSGDRISANTLDANRIKTSELTAANIVLNGGALIAMNPDPAVGLVMDSDGLSLYNLDGERVVFLEAATGQGTFEDVTVRGDITATDFTSISGASIYAEGGFNSAGDITGWDDDFSVATVSHDTVVKLSGAGSLKCAFTDILNPPSFLLSSDYFACSPGQAIEVRGSFKFSTVSINGLSNIYIQYYTSGNVPLTASRVKYPEATTSWQNLSFQSGLSGFHDIPPPTAAKFKIKFFIIRATVGALELNIDEISVHISPTVRAAALESGTAMIEQIRTADYGPRMDLRSNNNRGMTMTLATKGSPELPDAGMISWQVDTAGTYDFLHLQAPDRGTGSRGEIYLNGGSSYGHEVSISGNVSISDALEAGGRVRATKPTSGGGGWSDSALLAELDDTGGLTALGVRLIGDVYAVSLDVYDNDGWHFMNDDSSGYVEINASAFNINSSGAVKDDIRDLGPEAIMEIRPRRYMRRSSNLRGVTTTAELGFIAEELAEAVPEAVKLDGPRSTVNYNQIVPLLVAAVQDLYEKVNHDR